MCVEGGETSPDWQACSSACPAADQGQDECLICRVGGAQNPLWNHCDNDQGDGDDDPESVPPSTQTTVSECLDDCDEGPIILSATLISFDEIEICVAAPPPTPTPYPDWSIAFANIIDGGATVDNSDAHVVLGCPGGDPIDDSGAWVPSVNASGSYRLCKKYSVPALADKFETSDGRADFAILVTELPNVDPDWCAPGTTLPPPGAEDDTYTAGWLTINVYNDTSSDFYLRAAPGDIPVDVRLNLTLSPVPGGRGTGPDGKDAYTAVTALCYTPEAGSSLPRAFHALARTQPVPFFDPLSFGTYFVPGPGAPPGEQAECWDAGDEVCCRQWWTTFIDVPEPNSVPSFFVHAEFGVVPYREGATVEHPTANVTHALPPRIRHRILVLTDCDKDTDSGVRLVVDTAARGVDIDLFLNPDRAPDSLRLPSGDALVNGQVVFFSLVDEVTREPLENVDIQRIFVECEPAGTSTPTLIYAAPGDPLEGSMPVYDIWDDDDGGNREKIHGGSWSQRLFRRPCAGVTPENTAAIVVHVIYRNDAGQVVSRRMMLSIGDGIFYAGTGHGHALVCPKTSCGGARWPRHDGPHYYDADHDLDGCCPYKRKHGVASWVLPVGIAVAVVACLVMALLGASVCGGGGQRRHHHHRHPRHHHRYEEVERVTTHSAGVLESRHGGKTHSEMWW